MFNCSQGSFITKTLSWLNALIVLTVLHSGASVASAAWPVADGAALTSVHAAGKFFEGPTWDPLHERLYFSSLTSPTELLALTTDGTVEQWLSNSQGINGTFRSLDGRLLCAQGDTKRILSIDILHDGPGDIVELAANSSWNGPNDLCQTPSGDIYFTTPDFVTRTTSVVYHLAADGTVTPVVTDMPLCNGVIASLDGQKLYVSDSDSKHWKSYPILSDGTVGSGSIFFDPAISNHADPDGMTIDEHGNLYLNGRGSLWIVSPSGTLLEQVPMPTGFFNTNATFGGLDGKTLYITGDGHVYSLAMQVRGALWQGVPETNEPPVVDAGTDQLIDSRTFELQLGGSATDDGIPEPLSLSWVVKTSPSDPVFDDPTALNPVVTFDTVGEYVFELVAFDGVRAGRDELTVTVAYAGDFNNDGSIDSNDWSSLNTCLTGSEVAIADSECERADLDMDSDVDQADFGLWQRCLNDVGQSLDPYCAW
jgi:gluconolactonase